MACKNTIIKCFNSRAYDYDSAADVQPLIASRLARLLPARHARNILEIGCGTGLFSQYLSQHFPQSDLLLTDIAPAMLEVCQQRLLLHKQLTMTQMDGEALTTTSKFDLIASSMTLHWFVEIEKSLRQIMSRLARGGKFIFSMLGENSLQEWRELGVQNKVSIATPAFFSASKLQQQFPEFDLQVEVVKQQYPNARAFLKTLKSIGAHAPQKNHQPLSSGTLRRLMRLLDVKYPQGVSISYEVIYGSYANS
jgi:malonyl-CoA O-methyltransferase